MNSGHLQTLLRLFLFSAILCTIGLGEIFHGFGMQITNNGTGIYYKPGIPLNYDSQIIADIGFHFDSAIQTLNYYVYNNQKRSVFIEMCGSYKRELFKNYIVGTF